MYAFQKIPFILAIGWDTLDIFNKDSISLVHLEIYNLIFLAREEELKERAKALKVNAGIEPGTDLGPVISKQVLLIFYTSAALGSFAFQDLFSFLLNVTDWLCYWNKRTKSDNPMRLKSRITAYLHGKSSAFPLSSSYIQCGKTRRFFF